MRRRAVAVPQTAHVRASSSMEVIRRMQRTGGWPRRSALRRGAPTGPGWQPPHDPRSSRRPSPAAG
eukprot:8139154-Pyramimonas_sp.AAC.1